MLLPPKPAFPLLSLGLCNLNRAFPLAFMVTCVVKKNTADIDPQGILTSQEQSPTRAPPDDEKPFMIWLAPHSNLLSAWY